MGAPTATAAANAARAIVSRTTFSSAVNILPELTIEQNLGTRLQDDEITNELKSAKPYSQIPGPKELPLIGNSWRFAPIIGE